MRFKLSYPEIEFAGEKKKRPVLVEFEGSDKELINLMSKYGIMIYNRVIPQ